MSRAVRSERASTSSAGSRASPGTATTAPYQNLLAGAGYTDGTFRDLIRQQLQQEKYLAGLTADTTPTDAEIQTYYEANQQAYQSEPRITAREIVVADESKANALYAQALAGADFAGLARDNSTERAEQGGALGAAEGESTPKPVTSVRPPDRRVASGFRAARPRFNYAHPSGRRLSHRPKLRRIRPLERNP